MKKIAIFLFSRGVHRDDSVFRRFAHGSFWALVGAVSSQGLSMAASIIVARLLGKQEFGQLNLIQGTVGTASTFAGFGLGLTATRYVSAFRYESPGRAGNVVRLMERIVASAGGVAAIALIAIAPTLALSFRAPHLAFLLRLSSIYLFCITFNGVQTGVLAGFEAFRTIAVISFIRSLLYAALAVPLTRLLKAEGAITALTLSAMIPCIVSHFAVRSEERRCSIPLGDLDWSDLPLLWKFSVPSLLSGIMVGPTTWLASTMLARQPGGYAELGLFAAANQWRSVIQFLPGILSQPILPLLTSTESTSSQSRFAKVLCLSAVANGIVATASAVAVIAFAPMISHVYGKEFLGMTPVLIPLTIATVIYCVVTSVGAAMAKNEDMWSCFALNLLWAIVLLGLASWQLPINGARGLALSFLGAYCFHAITNAAYLFIRMNWISTRLGNLGASPSSDVVETICLKKSDL